jgi:hypothetical protein
MTATMQRVGWNRRNVVLVQPGKRAYPLSVVHVECDV